MRGLCIGTTLVCGSKGRWASRVVVDMCAGWRVDMWGGLAAACALDKPLISQPQLSCLWNGRALPAGFQVGLRQTLTEASPSLLVPKGILGLVCGLGKTLV